MIQKSDRIKTVIKKKNAFTLVELLIVITILVVMATIMIGVFNSIGITNKGRDAQRKKDLERIKVAFEEYYNDNGFFPQNIDLLSLRSSCGTDVFKPYLSSWPCDPRGTPYIVLVETNKFRIIANLENKKDNDIPDGWYTSGNFNVSATLNKDTVNYGVSSSNILWYEIVRDYSMCNINECFNGNDKCNDVTASGGCFGNCYYSSSSPGCVPECWVPCCGAGCNQ